MKECERYTFKLNGMWIFSGKFTWNMRRSIPSSIHLGWVCKILESPVKN